MPPSNDDSGGRDDIAHEVYTPEQQRTLSEAVLDTIETYTDTDLRETEFLIYDSINTDALDSLIPHEAESNIRVGFDVEHMRVRLWGNRPVEIEVSEQAS